MLSVLSWSAVELNPPETYPLTVMNQGGELLNVSQCVTSSLMRSTHQRCVASASSSQWSGFSGSHQSTSVRVVPSGAFHQPSTVPPARR